MQCLYQTLRFSREVLTPDFMRGSMTTLIVLARFVGSGDLIILKVVGPTYSSAIAKFVNTTSWSLLKPGTGRSRLLKHRTMRTCGTKQKLCDFCTLLQTPSLLLVSLVKL